MFQLQIFNPTIGRYMTGATDDDPAFLMEFGAANKARRVIRTDRRKPLPLKPRKVIPRPTRYKLGTAIEPATEGTLIRRAIDHYREREASSNAPIPVYYWRGSRFGLEVHAALQHGRFRFVELDPEEPGCAFGPDYLEFVPEDIAA